jgi:hypothetical protein
VGSLICKSSTTASKIRSSNAIATSCFDIKSDGVSCHLCGDSLPYNNIEESNRMKTVKLIENERRGMKRENG